MKSILFVSQVNLLIPRTAITRLFGDPRFLIWMVSVAINRITSTAIYLGRYLQSEASGNSSLSFGSNSSCLISWRSEGSLCWLVSFIRLPRWREVSFSRFCLAAIDQSRTPVPRDARKRQDTFHNRRVHLLLPSKSSIVSETDWEDKKYLLWWIECEHHHWWRLAVVSYTISISNHVEAESLLFVSTQGIRWDKGHLNAKENLASRWIWMDFWLISRIARQHFPSSCCILDFEMQDKIPLDEFQRSDPFKRAPRMDIRNQKLQIVDLSSKLI